MTVTRILSGLACGRRRKWLVIAVWLLLGVLVGSLARDLQHVRRNDPSVLAPYQAESTAVRERLSAADGARLPVVIVYARKAGPLTPADTAAVDADRRLLRDLDPTAPPALPS